MKRSTIINIAYYVITLPGLVILSYLQYLDMIPNGFALFFVALMIALRSILLKKFL